MESWVQSWRPRTNAFCIILRLFHSICLKYCACHEKGSQVIRSAPPVTQNHLSKPEDPMLQNGTSLRKSAPWPPNISNSCVSCTAPAIKKHLCRSSSNVPTCHCFWNATKPSHFAPFWQGAQSLAPATQNDIWTSKSAPYPSIFCMCDLDMCFAPQRRALFSAFSTSQLPKVVRHWSALHILTSKCASRHNGVHFLVLFRHLNFQKWSDTEVLCTFWLRNVLRATTACTFSTGQLPKAVRHWGVLCVLTWECASRHNGVRFLVLFRHLNFQKWSDTDGLCTFWLRNVLRATTACTFSTGQLPKAVRHWGVLCILTWECASRHNGVRFLVLFRHLNFQKGSDTEVLCTFWLRNVLRATTACTFQQVNFQKQSDTEVFYAFWLGNVLRATTVCTFSTCQLPKWSEHEVFCTFWVEHVLRTIRRALFHLSSGQMAPRFFPISEDTFILRYSDY